jgi:hypothetical protein
MTTRAEELEEIPSSRDRVRHMLEHLLTDSYVSNLLLCQRSAEIKGGILKVSICPPAHVLKTLTAHLECI